MTVVIVTEAEYGKGQATFVDTPRLAFVPAPNEEALLAAAIRKAGACYVILGHAQYIDDLYRAMPPGSVLARFGVGHEGIDKAKATAAGILCTNTPGTLDDSVAEHTVALLLAISRKLLPMTAAMRRGTWDQELGLEVRGSKIAVIGAGPIGRRVAEMASAGFGMRVALCDRTRAGKKTYEIPGVSVVESYEEAVADADFVSMHIPGTKENLHFLDCERLSKLRVNTWLINTSRGSIVDEVALYDLLARGSIAGAALDVFAVEPYVPAAPDKDLRTLNNVIMTPHVGSYTGAAVRRMAERALRNVQMALEGRYGEMDLLNPGVLEHLKSGL
jgi:phosphoglycerate dehydrogenase-like enzyme